MQNTKTCRQCGLSLPFMSFHAKKGNTGGFRHQCKMCVHEYDVKRGHSTQKRKYAPRKLSAEDFGFTKKKISYPVLPDEVVEELIRQIKFQRHVMVMKSILVFLITFFACYLSIDYVLHQLIS